MPEMLLQPAAAADKAWEREKAGWRAAADKAREEERELAGDAAAATADNAQKR